MSARHKCALHRPSEADDALLVGVGVVLAAIGLSLLWFLLFLISFCKSLASKFNELVIVFFCITQA